MRSLPPAPRAPHRPSSAGRTRTLLTLVAAGAAVGSSTAAWGHARWFLDPRMPLVRPTVSWDGLHGAMLAGAVVFMLAVIGLGLLAARRPWLGQALGRPAWAPAMLEWRLLGIIFGLTLVISSLEHVLIAPNLMAGTALPAQLALFAQTMLGAMLVAQSRVRLASGLLLALAAVSFALFSVAEMIDYAFEILAVAGALFVVGPFLTRPSPGGARWWQAFATPADAEWAGRDALALFVLRTGLGVQLVVLALHDKIIEPEVSLAFVQAYPFVNVPMLLGFEGFSHLHFVFGAGLAEIVFGVLLVLGTGTRIVASLLTGIFLVTGVIFGLAELMGHLPIACTALILALRGDAQPVPMLRPQRWRLASVGTLASGLVALALVPHVERPAPVQVAAIGAGTTLSDADPSLVVPATLFSGFASEAAERGLALSPELRAASEAIHRHLFRSRHASPPDKTATANRLFDLAVRYEAEKGADGTALWLRYAHLTGSCTPAEIAAFRATVSDPRWPQTLRAAPPSLVAALIPVAERAGRAILAVDADLASGEAWRAIAEAAPESGPGYAHTHALASIARILGAAAGHGHATAAAPAR